MSAPISNKITYLLNAGTSLAQAYSLYKDSHESTGFSGSFKGWPRTATLHFSDGSKMDLAFTDVQSLATQK